MPEDILYSLVVVPVLQAAQPAGESEVEMTCLDVTLSGLALQGNCLATVGAGSGQDTARWRLVGVLSLLVSVVLRVFVEQSSPLSLSFGARQLVRGC